MSIEHDRVALSIKWNCFQNLAITNKKCRTLGVPYSLVRLWSAVSSRFLGKTVPEVHLASKGTITTMNQTTYRYSGVEVSDRTDRDKKMYADTCIF